LTNAVLIWFLSRPRSEQIEIARAGRKASEWLRTQSEIPDFQRFDMGVILPAWESLKGVLGDHDKAGSADLAYQAAADRKTEGHSAARSKDAGKKPAQQKRRLRA
jgi:hypothetical protein